MYSLVSFTKEKGNDGSISCSVVPSIWISKDRSICWWPRGKNAYAKSFARLDHPKQDWEKCSPIIIKLSSDDLALVRAQQEVYLETSHLESDGGQDNSKTQRKVQRKVKPVQVVDSSDNDSDSLPSAPFVTTITSESVAGNSKQLEKEPVTFHENNDLHLGQVLLEVQAQSGHTIEILQQKTVSAKVPVSDAEKLILEKLEALSRKIDNLDFHIQALTPSQQITTEDLKECPKVPASTVQELQVCDVFCSKSIANIKKFAIVLSSVGGRTVKDATENVLEELMEDSVAAKYNWAGTKRGENRKLAFKKTRLVSLIYESLKNMRHHSGVERSEIEDPIKVWLKNAPARIKKSNNSEADLLDDISND